MTDTNQRHAIEQTGGRAKSLKSLDLAHPRPPHSEIFLSVQINFPAKPTNAASLRKLEYQAIELHRLFTVSERK